MSDQPLTSDFVVKFVTVCLSKIVNPSIVKSAVNDAAKQLGLTNVDAALEAGLAAAKPPSSARKSSAADGEKKSKREGKVNTYTLFITRFMSKMALDPSNPAYLIKDGEGKQQKKMSIASSSWTKLSDQDRDTWNKAYGPLAEKLNEDAKTSGVKTDHLLEKILEHERTLPLPTLIHFHGEAIAKEVKAKGAASVPPSAVKANGVPASAVKAAQPTSAVKAAAKPEESSEEESSDEEDEAPPAKPAVKKEESSDEDSSDEEDDEKAKKKKDKEKKKKDKKKKDKKRKKEEKESAKKAKKPKQESSSSDDSDSE